MPRHNFRELTVWQASMDLARMVYASLSELPNEEKFGLRSQITRAVVSVPSNIAEGSARGSNKHFKQYLETALGSLFELETQLILANDFQYISTETMNELTLKSQEIQKMMNGLIRKLDT
jgi:four helix bundle protein